MRPRRSSQLARPAADDRCPREAGSTARLLSPPVDEKDLCRVRQTPLREIAQVDQAEPYRGSPSARLTAAAD